MSQDMHDSAIEEILDFWFGALAAGADPWAHASAWFKKDDAFDTVIRQRFGSHFDAAAAGALDPWAETARGRLALIVVCDQLTRNAFRDTPRMYALDQKALALALDGLKRGMDRTLRMVERVFFIMPTMHAEDLEVQNVCVDTFGRLVAESVEPERARLEHSHAYAEQHRAIVARFGRFPHRNAILGRSSTREELAFLEEPGSRF